MIRYLALCLLLAACGGGGGGAPPAPPPVPTSAAFVSLFDQVGGDAITPPAVVQALGRVDYTGLARVDIAFDAPARSTYYGDLAVQFDFGAPALINGSIRDLRGDAGRLEGTLTLANGRFDADANPFTAYQFNADLAGNLAQQGRSYTASAQMQGDFRGTQGAGINGVIANGDLRSGADNWVFDGSFAATRD